MSLKARVFAAGSWVLAGYAGAQILRFATNVALTRLLFPEAFGMMVVVFAIIMGVNLLSDLGIAGGIVVHNAGSDEGYLNTAWTIQILRGLALGGLIFFAAGTLAKVFSNVELEPLLRIVSLAPIISGFTTTKVALADRQLNAKKRVVIDFGIQFVSAIVTTLLAWLLKSPAALAWGTVFSATLGVLAQHQLLPGPANKLHWEREHAREIISIGGFSFLSSALLYASGEGSRLFSATMIDSRMLGLIGLAGALAIMPWQAVQQLSQRVLTPAYAEVFRSGDSGQLRRVIFKARALQIIPCWVLSMATMVCAGILFSILYDSRYAEAAQILRVQCAGMLVAVLTSSYNGVLWSMKRFGLSMVLQGAQSVLLWMGMFFGFHVDGAMGLVIGTAVSSWAFYPVSFVVYRKLGLTNGWFDSIVLALSLIATLLLWHGTFGS